MKMRDWRSRAVVRRGVISLASEEREEEVVLEVVLFWREGKRMGARVSADLEVAGWQRVPEASMPQIPGKEGRC